MQHMEDVVITNEVDTELIKIINFFNLATDELKTKNRFSNERLDRLIDSLVNEKSNIMTLNAGIILYRARKYAKNDAEEKFMNPSNSIFQGYDKDNSYVNRAAPKEGRCNPTFIPYLYTAESITCCINEIEPHIGDIISVAEIRINKPIKVLKLAKPFASSNGTPSIIDDIADSKIILYLQNFFSKRHEKEWDYLLTQYIAEKIKNKGFDAISFFSSVYKGEGRTNYTIFSLDKCEAINSKLCKVSNITVEYTFDPPSYEEDLEYWQSGRAIDDFLSAID